MQMSPTCSKNERIVVPNRLVLSLFPDSIRLSSNMGFSYTRPSSDISPYDILDTGCGFLAPAISRSPNRSASSPASSGRPMILRYFPPCGKLLKLPSQITTVIPQRCHPIADVILSGASLFAKRIGLRSRKIPTRP